MKSIGSLIRLLTWPAKLLGADHSQFAILLRIKLTLNSRTEFTSFNRSAGNKTSFGYQLLLFSIIGGIFGLMLLFMDDLKTGMTFFFTFLMFMVGMSLLTEFTSVLFDKRDNHILLPRPVSHRTLLFTRIVHVQIFAGLIAMAFSLVVSVVLALKYSLLVFAVFLVAIGLLSWLTLEITTLVYMSVSRIVEKERFKDIINYIQIVFVIIMTMGYQLIGRMESSRILKVGNFPEWLNYILPPFWFTNMIRLGNMELLTGKEMISVLMAVILPVLGAILLVRFLSGGFERLLASMDVESTKPVKTRRSFLPVFLRRIMCASQAEVAGWDLTMATTNRDRKFKVNTYPSFFMVAVFSVLLMKPGFISGGGEIFSFILATIMAGFGGFNAIIMLPYTDTPQAAWVYLSMPVANYGKIFTGAIKAIYVKFFLPLGLIALTAAILFRGFSDILLVLQGLSGANLIAFVILYFKDSQMPFSQSYDVYDKGSMTSAGLLLLLVALLLGGFLFLTTFLPGWVPLIFIAASIVMIHFILKNLGSQTYRFKLVDTEEKTKA